MRPQSLFEVLDGQQLAAVLAVERWGTELAPNDEQAAWPLYGALGLMFETHALLLTSPLRSSRSQNGTRIGMANGSSVALGLRATLCETEQAAAMVSFRLGMPPAESLHWWTAHDVPVAGQRLQGPPSLDLDASSDHAPIWFEFEEGDRYRLQYRRDLDGAIEFATAGQHAAPACIAVTQPKGPLAWLHPDRITGFVIDNQRWRSARQWPIDVRRRLRDADPQGPEVRTGHSDCTFKAKSMKGQPDGTALEILIECCPPKVLQRHNAFGHADLLTSVYQVFCRVTEALKIKVSPEDRERWRTGEFWLTEVHITGMFRCPRFAVLPIIQAIDEAFTEGKQRNIETSITVGSPGMRRSKHRALTAYDKYLERLSAWPNPGPYQARILDWLKETLRLELKLYSDGLRHRGLQQGKAWREVDVMDLYFGFVEAFKLTACMQPLLPVADAVAALEALAAQLLDHARVAAPEHVFHKAAAVSRHHILAGQEVTGHSGVRVSIRVGVVLRLGIGDKVAGDLEVPRDSVLLRAYVAFFLQNLGKAQRLMALGVPVHVSGITAYAEQVDAKLAKLVPCDGKEIHAVVIPLYQEAEKVMKAGSGTSPLPLGVKLVRTGVLSKTEKGWFFRQLALGFSSFEMQESSPVVISLPPSQVPGMLSANAPTTGERTLAGVISPSTRSPPNFSSPVSLSKRCQRPDPKIRWLQDPLTTILSI